MKFFVEKEMCKMSEYIVIEGFDEFEESLKKSVKNVDDVLKKSIKAGAKKVLKIQKDIVKSSLYDTGLLHRELKILSIKRDKNGDLIADIGLSNNSKAFYGKFWNYGHMRYVKTGVNKKQMKFRQGIHFIEKSAELGEKEFIKTIESELSKIISELNR